MAMTASTRNALRFKAICLVFEKREDGGLRVWSDDVPGFVLSHSDSEAVFADVERALETILSEMFSARVRVGPLEKLQEDLELAGFLPSSPSTPARRTYVAELCA